MKKIFVIGPNKSGSLSLYYFFKKNNLKPVHWERGNLALKNFIKYICKPKTLKWT